MCVGVKNSGFTLAIFLVVSLFGSLLAAKIVCADSETIVVPDDYATISAAVDAASEGATVYVKKGTYNETLEIWKHLTLIGEDTQTTIINGQNSGTVILVRHDNITVTGFTVVYTDSQNSPDPWFLHSSRLVGIHMIDVKYCNVYENKILDCGCGIWLFDSSQNNVIGNSVIRNDYGIRIESSSNNTITTNNCKSNYGGMWLISASNNKLRNNVMRGNSKNFGISSYEVSTYVNDIDESNVVDGKPIYYWVGVSERAVPSDAGLVVLVNCTDIMVQGTNITRNKYGLVVAFTKSSIIQNNSVSESNQGIYLHSSVDINVTGNTIHSYVGIGSSSNGTIISNNVINGTGGGINLGGYRQTVTGNIVSGGRFGGGTHIIDCTGLYNNITSNSLSGYVGVVLGGSYNFFQHNTIAKGDNMWVTDEGNVVVENRLLGMGIVIKGSNHIVCANNISGALSFSRDSSNNTNCWNYRKHGVYNDIDGFNPDSAHESIKYTNMGNWIQTFDAGTWEWTQYNIDLVSNSIGSDFSFEPEAARIQFTVEGETGKTGFCRVTIPKDMLQIENSWSVLVDGEPVTSTVNQDPVNSYIYFTYQHSTKNIEITGTTAIPEFSSWLILPLILAYAVTIILTKKRIQQKSRKRK